MRYAEATMRKELEEEAYRIYVTEVALGLLKGSGGDMGARYYDIIHPSKHDERSGEEIALDILSRLTGEEVKREST